LSLTPGSVAFQNDVISAQTAWTGTASGSCSDGSLQFVQLVNANREITFVDGSRLAFSSGGTDVLDVDNPSLLGSGCPATLAIFTADSPQLGLRNTDSIISAVTISDQFRVYLMFQPNSGARYTLGIASWSFISSVNRQPNGSLTLGTNALPTTSGTESSVLPSPNSTINALTWQVTVSPSQNSYANQLQSCFNTPGCVFN